MKIDNIIIEDRTRKYLGDIQQLAKSIQDIGLLHPVVVDSDNRLIAGYRRVKAFELLGIDEIPHRIVNNLNDALSLLVAERDENICRLNFAPSEAVELGKRIEPLEQKKSKDSQGTRTDVQHSSNLDRSNTNGRSDDKVSQAVGLGRTSYRKAKKVVEFATENPEYQYIVDKMDESGKIDRAAKEVKRIAREQKNKATRKFQQPTGAKPQLYLGHAENMCQLESELVDIIITSPPYNLNRNNWKMGGEGRTPRLNGIGYDQHSDNLPESDYQDWQIECLKEMYRVAKQGASLFYNHKVRNKEGKAIFPHEWLLRKDNPWTVRQEIIWDRTSTHNHNPKYFWPEDERIFWMTKGDNPNLHNDTINLTTIWNLHGPKPDTWHPAPFIEDLPKQCLEAIGGTGLIVLDPFAGSCTTLRVALSLGFEAIGYDISENYLSKAREENGW